MIKRDIFISYSSKNLDEAEIIRDELKRNGFTCWMAPDDIRAGENYAEEIMEGLKAATMVVLVFSKDAQQSIYVTNEIKTAFNMKKPIVAYKIDETLPVGKMEFYLKNKQWIDASVKPSYTDSFDDLVANARRLYDDELKKTKHKIDLKIPIIIAVAVILIAVVGFIVFGGNGDVQTDTISSSNITIDFVEVIKEDGSFSYSVLGSVPDQLSNSSKDVVHTDFLDESGKVVASDDVKIGDVLEGNVLGSTYQDKNNVVKVSVKLQDSKGNVFSSAESTDIQENLM